MEIFNVGIQEFLLVMVLAFILLGPEGFKKTSKEIGKAIYRFMRSPTWMAMNQTYLKLRKMPREIVRESGLEESVQDLHQEDRNLRSQVWTPQQTIWNPRSVDPVTPPKAPQTDLPGDQEILGQAVEGRLSEAD